MADTWQILNPDTERIWIAGNRGSTRTGESLRHKLNRQTQVTPDCHLWTGSRNAGEYGTISVDQQSLLVSRVVFRLTHGYWPTIVRHTCDNPPCINPAHLIDGTRRDNSTDRDTRGRNGYSRRTHCPQGHEYTPENTAIRTRGSKRPGQTYRECRQCRRKKT